MSNIIKILRNQKGLTQDELGAYLGVKKSAIQKYESGAIVNLKSETIRKLCDLFDVSPSFFIYDFNDLNYPIGKPSLYHKISKKWRSEQSYVDVVTNASKLNYFALVKVNDYIRDLSKIKEYVDSEF